MTAPGARGHRNSCLDHWARAQGPWVTWAAMAAEREGPAKSQGCLWGKLQVFLLQSFFELIFP